MNIEAKAKEVWNHTSVDAQLNETNMLKWIDAVKWLGNRWVLAETISLVKKGKK